MDAFIDWLEDQPRAAGRIRHHRREPGQEGEYSNLELEDRVATALAAQGIDELYSHQADAIRAIRNGQNVVVATPTASGKSLIYTIPALEAVLSHGGHTLYIAPMRALINDQEEALRAGIDALGFGARPRLAQYTGQQTSKEKERIRADQPHVLLTTPDMLHLGILPHAHRLWEWFFKAVEFVVIDEVHEYRGVFGSHVALVLRRLARICDRFEAAPQYVCCSATIGNPVEHASAITGQSSDSFALVDEDTSSTGARHWLFWNPPLKQTPTAGHGSAGSWHASESHDRSEIGGNRRSPHPETARLLADLVQQDYQTLVFTSARQIAERYAEQTASILTRRGEADLGNAIGAYQAALPQNRREELEGRLASGSLRGVWSTNALELGIDIGELDAVLLDGYPGTRMETHQRAGRAGRGTESSLVALVGGQDQLDQYIMGHPESVFEQAPELAIVNPTNPELLPDHVRCAARENWLKPDDAGYFGEDFPSVVSELEATGDLERRSTRVGTRWTDVSDGDHRGTMSLRSIEEREIALVDAAREETIATLQLSDALRDAHPGAIYYHQGQTYEVIDLDVDRCRAILQETYADYYTRAIREKDITVTAELDDRRLPTHADMRVVLAEAVVRERIDSYLRYVGPDDEGELVELDQPLPETTLRTQTILFSIPPDTEQAIRALSQTDTEFLGALHAIEHGIISLFPLELLCDRRDIGGLSTTIHPHTDRSTIFIHDGHPGGVGLARGGFDVIDTLLDETQEMIAGCPCTSGCPACIQSPHCGNANTALEKELAVDLLTHLH